MRELPPLGERRELWLPLAQVVADAVGDLVASEVDASDACGELAAKESEGEARHTGVGVQRFGAADTRFVFWRIRRGKERLVWSKRGVSSLFHQKGKRLPRGAVEI